MVPNGDWIGSPPANGAPPSAVWQAMQSAARARYSPRLTSAASAPAAEARNGDSAASARARPERVRFILKPP